MRDRSATLRLRGRAGETVTLRAYVMLAGGVLASPTNVASIEAVIEPLGGAATFPAAALTVADVLFDPVVTSDPNYNSDGNDSRSERGYNLAWTPPATAFPAAGWYTARLTITSSDELVTVVVFEGPIRGSI